MVRYLSTGQVGRLCGVSPVTIAKWIDEGILRGHATQGGHRRVAAGDLIAFLKRHHIAVPPQLETVATRRILSAAADEPLQDALRSVVETASPRVEYCALPSGTQALVRLGSWRPHLLLLSLGLEDVDTLAVCRWLGDLPEIAGTVVTVVNAELDEHVMMGSDNKLTVVFAPRSKILTRAGAFLEELLQIVDDRQFGGPGESR